MKTLIIAGLTVFHISQLTASPDVSRFEDAQIEMPPLALSGIKPEGHSVTPPMVITITPTENKMISNMPVIVQSDAIEYNIIIKEPDSSVGYALITREFDMTPTK